MSRLYLRSPASHPLEGPRCLTLTSWVDFDVDILSGSSLDSAWDLKLGATFLVAKGDLGNDGDWKKRQRGEFT